jgi:hypothetical protein
VRSITKALDVCKSKAHIDYSEDQLATSHSLEQQAELNISIVRVSSLVRTRALGSTHTHHTPWFTQTIQLVGYNAALRHHFKRS